LSLIILVIDHAPALAPADQSFDFVFEASGAKLKVKRQFDEGASARLSNAMVKSAQELQHAERVERVAKTLIGVLGGVAYMAI
jgi:nicotinate-nucleotide pyrophosphorylase